MQLTKTTLLGITLWISLVFGLVSAPHTAAAEPAARVVVVVNRAEWCSVCKTNGPRVASLLMKASRDGGIAMLVNDVTDEQTAKKSRIALKAAGLDNAVGPASATGVLYLFDAKTRRPLHQVTVANTDREIEMTIELAKKEATAP